jgi:hypothetical protein
MGKTRHGRTIRTDLGYPLWAENLGALWRGREAFLVMLILHAAIRD